MGPERSSTGYHISILQARRPPLTKRRVWEMLVEETGLPPRQDTGCRVAVRFSNSYRLTVREKRAPRTGWLLIRWRSDRYASCHHGERCMLGKKSPLLDRLRRGWSPAFGSKLKGVRGRAHCPLMKQPFSSLLLCLEGGNLSSSRGGGRGIPALRGKKSS